MGGGPSQAQQNAAQSQANLTNQLGATFGKQQQFQQTQQNKANPFYTQQMNQGNGYTGQFSPFYQQRMQGGLPYYNNLTDAASGNTARAFQPARAQLEQQLHQGANALPSGFAQQARTDLATQQAQAFDQNLQGAQAAQEAAKQGGAGNLQQLLAQNLMARQAGASGLLGQAQLANPTAYSGQALQGNQSIMNAPLASPGISGLLGGLAGGLASSIPF